MNTPQESFHSEQEKWKCEIEEMFHELRCKEKVIFYETNNNNEILFMLYSGVILQYCTCCNVLTSINILFIILLCNMKWLLRSYYFTTCNSKVSNLSHCL